jgi:transcription antitermination factor NusG
LDNMVGKMVQIPFGTFIGMKAKIHRITKNQDDIRASICQLFVKEPGIFLDAKVSFTLGELTKS